MNREPNNALSDTVAKLQEGAKAVVARRWYAIGVAIIVCVVGWPIVMALPDKYESQARVFVDTKSILKPLLHGLAVDSDITQEFAYVTRRTLLSSPNLERVLRETDLDLKLKDREQMELAIRDMEAKISIVGDSKESIYTIKYDNEDPQAAFRVVQSLLNIFVETSLGATRTDTDLTRQFLDQQIQEYEAKLVAAENRLKEFKQKNIGSMPTQAGGYFQRLDAVKNNYRTAQLTLREAEKRRDELKRQLIGVKEFVPQGTVTGAPDPLDLRIQVMEAKLDELRLQYTDNHPNVISLRNALVELKEQKKSELTAGNDGGDTTTLTQKNPVYQDLQVDLGRAQAEVAALQVRVTEYKHEVTELTKRVDTIPKVEAELARLNRDYEINKNNYDALVARRESAKISREAAQSADDLQFKIIEPPAVPLVPLGPNRTILLTLVLIASFGAGSFAAWALAQVKPTFDSISSLKLATHLPVFGSVSLVPDHRLTRRRRIGFAAFFFVLALLLTVYAGLVFLQTGALPTGGANNLAG